MNNFQKAWNSYINTDKTIEELSKEFKISYSKLYRFFLKQKEYSKIRGRKYIKNHICSIKHICKPTKDLFSIKGTLQLGNAMCHTRDKIRLRGYRISMQSGLLTNLFKNKRYKGCIKRIKTHFIITNDHNGNLISTSGRKSIISICRCLLNKNELIEFEKKEKKTIQISLKVDLGSFRFNISDLIPKNNLAEKELVDSLIKEGYNIEISPFKNWYDIKIKDGRWLIEVTTLNPSDKYPQGVHHTKNAAVRCRILEFEHYREKGFIIINSKWKKVKNIFLLSNEVKNKKIYVLYTDFKKDWTKNIIKDINKVIYNEKRGNL